jgi:hypothetical protein
MVVSLRTLMLTDPMLLLLSDIILLRVVAVVDAMDARDTGLPRVVVRKSVTAISSPDLVVAAGVVVVLVVSVIVNVSRVVISV